MTNTFKQISTARWFHSTVTVAILIAAVLVGMSTYEAFAAKHNSLLEMLNTIVLIIFIMELAVKMLAEGNQPWRYFDDGWNIFDFVIVITAFLPFGGSSIAILRLLRLLRVLKLIKALPKLQVLVETLLKSIPSMAYVSLLLFLLFYIYAVAGVFIFGENDPVHFKNLQMSMLTLFRVVTLEDWTDVMYINMYGCANYGYEGSAALCNNSQAFTIISPLYFVSFVLLGTMIMLNLFIGVIMNGMDEAKQEAVTSKTLETKETQVNQVVTEVSLEQLEEKLREIQDLVQNLKGASSESVSVSTNALEESKLVG
ncbi:MAG TPA: potassium transporter [Microscillaceae bacterium]|nr:potassium transporter [Microscillaceae bacterium]